MSMETIEIGEPLDRARAALLCLHGRGVDGRDLAPVAEELGLAGWHFSFPHAPLPFPGGGRAWYEGGPGKGVGIPAAAEQVREELRRLEEGGVPSRRIGILAFSQGVVVGLHAALRHPRRLGCVVALSGYLYAPEKSGSEASEANGDLPIFMGHGRDDDLIPVDVARKAATHLKDEGYPVDYREYPMGHGVSPEELEEVRTFLNKLGTVTN